MGRRSKNESVADTLLDIMIIIFKVVPPWSSIPVAAIGFCLIAYIWCSVITFPQLHYIGILFGAMFAIICLLGGWKGVQHRQRQQQFLAANIDMNWVRGLSWQEFESQMAEVYRQSGYTVEETGGGGPDGGVDLKLVKDGRTTVVQCKHWKTWKVNVKPVRELFGVMTAERADAAILITSGDYTVDAREFGEGKPIKLIDREGFLDLVRQFQRDLAKQHGIVQRDVQAEMKKSAIIDRLATPVCPRCRSAMKLRTATKGECAGSQFWGCSRFPDCRGTRSCQDA
jgi:restriction system protein